MSVVAARTATVRKEAPANSRTALRRYRAKRRTRSFWRAARPILLGVVVVSLFGYAGLYATLAATSFSKNRLAAECRREMIVNQRLKLEYDRRSSPESVVAAAQKAGMVYATEYEYLPAPQQVASAKKDR